VEVAVCGESFVNQLSSTGLMLPVLVIRSKSYKKLLSLSEGLDIRQEPINPGSSKIKEVIGNMGMVRLQLIQPIEGKSMFQEFLDTRSEDIHHYAFLVDDIEKEGVLPTVQYGGR